MLCSALGLAMPCSTPSASFATAIVPSNAAAMACFTGVVPMRAAVPVRVAAPAARPALAVFSGMRMTSGMPQQLAGEKPQCAVERRVRRGRLW